MTKHHFIHNDKQNSLDEDHVYEKLSEHSATFRAMVEDAVGPLNALRTAARVGKRGNKSSRDSLVKMIKDKYKQEMVSRLYLLGSRGIYTPRGVMLAGLIIPFWADALCYLLVDKHHITQKEALNAARILQNEGIDAVPSLSVRASLEAMMAHKSINETTNGQVDIMRIAVALPFADIMLIDGPKASYVRELELDKRFQTTVFSGRRTELVNLKKQLESVLDSS